MKIWIVTIYEPLPFCDVRTRPQRCGMLAKALLDRGHSVELWTSAFDHVSHKHLYKRSLFEKVGERISIQFIKGCGYPNDLSLKRFLHNRQTGREFIQLANCRKESPDIIFAPVPILELAQAAVEYANKRNIPIIVDIRDLWPDVYLSMLPKFLHSIGKKLLYSEYRRAKNVFKNATGITAVSKAYLQRGLSYAQRGPRNTDKFYPLGSGDFIKPNLMQSDEVTDSILHKYGIDPNQFIVTYVGTFCKSLDVENILRAARLLIDKKEIRIFIVGTGDRSKEFYEMATRLPNVTMTGWLNNTEIRPILNQTKVGLVAYSKDAIMSLPNKPFEYMAAGLPLLSSLSGELEQLIQEYGIGRSYEAGNPASLAEGIRWFYDHPEESRQMGARSLALFSTRFRSDIVYKEFSEHLEWIVRRDGRKQG